MDLRPQATVRQFDPETRSGSVLFDDGTELAFDAAAFERGGLLKVRLGQRVRLLLTDNGHRTGDGAETRVDAGADGSSTGRAIVALTIVTMPFPPGIEPGSARTG